MMKTTILLTSLLSMSFPVCATDYWKEYLDSRNAYSDLRNPTSTIPEENILPNFSYAGYQFGEQNIPDTSKLNFTVFHVTDFGAVANDNKSDKQAFRNTIQAAEQYIDKTRNGAIIQFPVGTFHLNERTDMNHINMTDTKEGRENRNSFSIQLSRSNLIVRGNGSKTILYMDQHLPMLYPTKMWTTPHFINIGYNYKNPEKQHTSSIREPVTSPTGEKFITTVTSNHPRGSTRSITVADPSALKPNQWVRLTRFDNRAKTIKEALSPYQPDPSWTSINKGLRSQELHQIETVSGNTVTFKAVIHHEVADDGYWGLKKASMIKNVGFENLTFQGNWKDDFKHHKNGLHDSGWSAVRLSNVANSWVRNVQFEDVNQGITIANSAASTIKNITFTGNPAHLSLDINASTHVLADNIQDQANHWHAAGFSHRAVGNVLMSSYHSPERFHNLHSDMPTTNLIENNTGGWNYGFMGGSISNQPNHLKYLVFWNPLNTARGSNKSDWSFMRDSSAYGRVIMPYVVGLKSNTFKNIKSQKAYAPTLSDKPQAHVQATTAVHSLYQSQLEQRLSVKAPTQ